LLKVGDLQKQGVTLHLDISTHRDAVPDVAAIYFVSPSGEAVEHIAADVTRRLYDAFHLNFASPIPRPLMETLAQRCVASDSVRAVSKLFDHSCSFVSLEPNLFTLNRSESYFEMHKQGLKDNLLMAQLEEIAEGLFGVVATLGRVPVIRAQPGEASAMIADMLNKKLQKELRERESYFSGDIGHQRPLLVLLDRQVDLPVMLHHGWAYQALVHETTPTRLNHVTCKSQNSTTQNDLDASDAFWMDNKHQEFPHAADAMDGATKQYKADEEAFKLKTAGSAGEGAQLVGQAATQGLTDAIHLIPEMQERKHRIDIHTNLLTSILEQIKKRSLNKLHQLELAMMRSGALDAKELDGILNDEEGDHSDRVRLAMIRSLTAKSKEEAEAAEAAVSGLTDAAALEYLHKLQALLSMGTSSPAGPEENKLAGAASWMRDALSSATNLASNMMGAHWKANATRIVEGVMEQYGTPEVEQMIYLDPRANSSTQPQVKSQYKDAIVFVVGGGCYTEFLNLQQVLRTPESDRNITYGSTELCSPQNFLKQLAKLK